MTGRFITTVATVATVAALLGMPAAAHAQDRRPCVSKVEFWGLRGADLTAPTVALRASKMTTDGLTRSYVEHRWDVAGVGRRDRFLTDGHGIGYDYPACGYSFSHAQVWVIYRRGTGIMVADLRWVEPGAPHRSNV